MKAIVQRDYGSPLYVLRLEDIDTPAPADIERAVNYVRQGLGEALAGKPISAAVTRPYGCSVKYKS